MNDTGFGAFADFLDGREAVVRRVALRIEEGAQPALAISVPEAPDRIWPLASIRALRDQADPDVLIVTTTTAPLARLIVTDADTQAVLARRCTKLRRRPPVRGVGRLVAWAAAAVASVALIVFVLVPAVADRLAEYLPPEGEKALGDTTLEQIRNALDDTGFRPLPICDEVAGTEALRRMRARLTAAADLPYELTVTVLDHEMVNAFALPGGHVVFFSGLIDVAESPDEIAAVFAHEMGHVAARDPTRIALRSAGSIGVLGLLLGDFAGGAVVLFLAERLIQADYTQAAEAAADGFAHELLRTAGVSPAALGTMFERLREKHGDSDGIVAHLSSHPALGDRIARARAAAEGSRDRLRPILTETEWQALRGICN